MKIMKRLMVSLMALAIMLLIPLNARAVDITVDDGEVTGASYEAYRIFDATEAAGTGAKRQVAYTLNSKYEAVVKQVTGKTSQADIIDYVQNLDNDGIRTFANSIYAAIKTAGLAADATATDNKFSNVGQGYYLIAETNTGSQTDDEISLVMLATAGLNELTVTTKEDKPTLVKKVGSSSNVEVAGFQWQDGATYGLKDVVPFKLTATVSKNLDQYKEYKFEFHDTLSADLTFNADSVKIMAGSKDITQKFTVAEQGGNITMKCADLKGTDGVTAGGKIVVTYTATVNDQAVTGKPGNPNKAKIVFSNNPYGDGTGETPEDKVTVFTFKVTANKTDDQNKPLEGAGFTLYKEVEGQYQPVGAEITNVTSFTFSQLNVGKYKLVETTVPAGYNKAADIEFTIAATYDTEADDPQLKTLTVDPADSFTVDLDTGCASTTVVNKSGQELPGTGGLGRTILYVVGSVAFISAAVLLLARKKNNQNN